MFLEKEMQEWKENNLEGLVTLNVDDFDAKRDLKELVRLFGESKYKEVKKHVEEPPQCGEIPSMAWEAGSSRSNGEKETPMA